MIGGLEALHDHLLDFAGRKEEHGEQQPIDDSFTQLRDFILASYAHEPYRRRVENAVDHRAIGKTESCFVLKTSRSSSRTLRGFTLLSSLHCVLGSPFS